MPKNLILNNNETNRLEKIIATDDVEALRLLLQDVAKAHSVPESDWMYWTSMNPTGVQLPLLQMMGAAARKCLLELTLRAFAPEEWAKIEDARRMKLDADFMTTMDWWTKELRLAQKRKNPSGRVELDLIDVLTLFVHKDEYNVKNSIAKLRNSKDPHFLAVVEKVESNANAQSLKAELLVYIKDVDSSGTDKTL